MPVSTMSDEELMAIANGSPSVSTMSDDELMSIAGVQPKEPLTLETGARQVVSGINRAINTATGNIPEIIMNKLGVSGYAQNENPLIKATGEAVGFIAPGGAPMRAIGALNAIRNPLTRAVAQGAGAMATQLPTGQETGGEYAGKVVGGGVVGGAIPVLAKPVDKFLSPLAKKTEELITKNAKVYRNVLNPGKGIINAVETKSGKKIDDFMKLAADEQLVITSNDGKLDTKAAIASLKDRKVELNAQLDSALSSDTTKKFNLLDIAEMAKENIRKFTRNASDLKASIKSVDDQIADEIALYGEKSVDALGNEVASPMVDGITANRIKGGMWDKSYDLLNPNNNKVSRQIGFSIKDAIEKLYPDQAIKETNARLGDYVTLENILKKSHGQVVQGGKLGNYVFRGVGAAAGGALGHSLLPVVGGAAGTVAGSTIGNQASKFLSNPERITKGLKVNVSEIAKAGSKLGEIVRDSVKKGTPIKTNAQLAELLKKSKQTTEEINAAIAESSAHSKAPNAGSKSGVEGDTQGSRVIPRAKGKRLLGSNKGQVVIPSYKIEAPVQKFIRENPNATAEEYVASRLNAGQWKFSVSYEKGEGIGWKKFRTLEEAKTFADRNFGNLYQETADGRSLPISKADISGKFEDFDPKSQLLSEFNEAKGNITKKQTPIKKK